MSKNNQYKTLVSEGKVDLTTYTDFVSKYPVRLQRTTYCFPSTETTLKEAAGIVKAVGLFEKNPLQHAVDYEMLTNNVCLGMLPLKVISSNMSSVFGQMVQLTKDHLIVKFAFYGQRYTTKLNGMQSL